jgi:2-keto-4-pentenoate hydratase/2-oxohepta-3-ene-1,7-dioic acid hydratase in catechol pathway
MRHAPIQIARFAIGTDVRCGVVDGEQLLVHPRRPSAALGVADVLADADRFAAAARASGHRVPLAEVRLLAPVPRPGKVFAIGLNYADHIAESGMQAPEVPTVFAKFVNTVVGPADAIQRPRISPELDYEGELAIVIGTRCRHVPRERALEVIGGYTILNDVSVRDWQRLSPQWSMGKSFDTHAPTGPWVSASAGFDASDLPVRTWVNGELRQDSTTAQLVFDAADLVAHISQACTLEPGDLIATGTPGGVGGAMSPPQYLVPGDRVRIEIGGIGAIENAVVDEPADSAHIGDEPLVTPVLR